MNDLLLLLVKNISPEPCKRERLRETREKYEVLFKKFTNWDFIKELSTHKMIKLYEVLYHK
jgi:hypothetical protein